MARFPAKSKREQQSALNATFRALGMEQFQTALKPQRAPRKKRVRPSESQEQQVVIGWWNSACKGYGLPSLSLFSIPNGAVLAGDARYRMIQMSRLKREGLRKGVFDLMLAFPKSGYHGLFIEMKVGANKLSDEQEAFMQYIVSAGYQATARWSADEAIKAIKDYLA